MGKTLSNTHDYNEHRCICCWLVVVPAKVFPRVCVECFAKLTLGDRAAIVAAANHTELLRDIRRNLDVLARNNDNDENQLGSIAKSFENFGRMLKLPAGKGVELANQVMALVRLLHEQAERAADGRDGGDGDSNDYEGDYWKR